jgi:hypothetical protein
MIALPLRSQQQADRPGCGAHHSIFFHMVTPQVTLLPPSFPILTCPTNLTNPTNLITLLTLMTLFFQDCLLAYSVAACSRAGGHPGSLVPDRHDQLRAPRLVSAFAFAHACKTPPWPSAITLHPDKFIIDAFLRVFLVSFCRSMLVARVALQPVPVITLIILITLIQQLENK